MRRVVIELLAAVALIGSAFCFGVGVHKILIAPSVFNIVMTALWGYTAYKFVRVGYYIHRFNRIRSEEQP